MSVLPNPFDPKPFDFGPRPKDWPSGFDYPMSITFTGMWDGTHFVVGLMRTCDYCGIGFDDTNECNRRTGGRHNGGWQEPMVLVRRGADGKATTDTTPA